MKRGAYIVGNCNYKTFIKPLISKYLRKEGGTRYAEDVARNFEYLFNALVGINEFYDESRKLRKLCTEFCMMDCVGCPLKPENLI